MKVQSNWRSVRLWESALERDLHRRHSLRTHGILIGTFMLLLMWGVSALQMHLFRVDSLALRYFITLGVGYVGYLLVLRWWAARLVEGRGTPDAGSDGGSGVDVVDAALDLGVPDVRIGSGAVGARGGSSGSGGSASGSNSSGGSGLGEAGSLLDAVGSADEGAVIVVPVIAIFFICTAIVLGAGSLVMLYFSWDALLAVALEVAFSYVSARAVVRVAREGWLLAAVRLTWKPLLGALLSAVLLGALLDHFMPQAASLPQAVRMLLHPHSR